jgi:hypothetical protein
VRRVGRPPGGIGPALIFLFRFFIKKKMKARPAGQKQEDAENYRKSD